MIECPWDGCEKEVSSQRGLTFHTNRTHEAGKPYMDRDTMIELYRNQGLTSRQIADVFGVTKTTILDWLDRLDISIQTPDQDKPPTIHQNEDGYEYFKTKHQDTTAVVMHSRLLAVAIWGVDAVKGKEVHHINRIPWDNRPGNLRLMRGSEHKKHHHKQGHFTHRQRRDDGTYRPKSEWNDAEMGDV